MFLIVQKDLYYKGRELVLDNHESKTFTLKPTKGEGLKILTLAKCFKD